MSIASTDNQAPDYQPVTQRQQATKTKSLR
jgi:hypothetical protein